MAHFAEIDSSNVVLRVVVIGNADTSDANGVEKEHIGAAFCEKLFGGVWKQTSYNGNMRKRYAGIGYTYNAELDAFVPPKPFPSWTLNSETADWQAPVAMPTEEGKRYAWNEETGAWDEIEGMI
ncbi:MAG: hypothetical protein EBU90_14915 [Proteobacteria bacterium]|nr:hypothetical protein [Pseudomonadota bacterium]